VQGFDLVEVQAQGFEEDIGEHGDAIIFAPSAGSGQALPSRTMMLRQAQHKSGGWRNQGPFDRVSTSSTCQLRASFDTQTQNFHEAQAAAIQKLGHETVDALHVLNHFFCFLF